ncbi:hypothetical protein ACIA5E_27650 [Nocardia asteroides]|uniref:hypothetical protein n=1 Tax=Nocardia asteroides TaxID=1824 RepID=UPI00379C3E77
MLQADIDNIKALAGTLDDVAAKVDAIDVRSAVTAVSSGLAGTTLGEACGLATEYTEGAWLRASRRIVTVASAMRTTATDLAATDSDFGKRMDEFDFAAQGTR